MPNAGLVARVLLAQRLGISALVDQRVRLASWRGRGVPGRKGGHTVVGAMLAGADGVDDVAVLRRALAVSCLTTRERRRRSGRGCPAFKWPNVRQLDAAAR